MVLETLGSRWGSGLLPLLHSKDKVDLVLLMAGTNDLGTTAPPEEIAAAIRGLHGICHQAGVRTVALGIPDAGGWNVARIPALAARKRAVNASLAAWTKVAEGCTESCESSDAWTKPELFINTVALMPYGPRSRGAGDWASIIWVSPKVGVLLCPK